MNVLFCIFHYGEIYIAKGTALIKIEQMKFRLTTQSFPLARLILRTF